MGDDIFCKIIRGELKSDLVAEGEEWIAFKDINPQAPVHALIIPKAHISGVREAQSEQGPLLGKLLLAANIVGEKLGLEQGGFRLIINCGPDASQAVPHLHIHLIGGKKLGSKVE